MDFNLDILIMLPNYFEPNLLGVSFLRIYSQSYVVRSRYLYGTRTG